MTTSLWGDEFVVEPTPKKAKKIIDKVNKPKSVSKSKAKISKSKDISITISEIKEEVYRILGKYKDNTIVITNKNDLDTYIDYAIKNGEIAIDTETNNTLEPIGCKLMGLCIYTEGQKQAYIPVNHVDINTKEKLPNQVTEQEIKECLTRLGNTKIIMHNGSFDYQVIKYTVGLPLNIYWDTIIGARLLNENEEAKLKVQYQIHIDNSSEKYNIEELFKKMEYAIFEPDLFALYAATDAYMTYKLYKWQVEQFKLPENKKVYKLFREVEMPVVTITAEMEYYGICVENKYANQLSNKFHDKLKVVEEKLNHELENYKETIDIWRTTREANLKPVKDKNSGKNDKRLPLYVNSIEEIPNNSGYDIHTVTLGKSKNEKLADPPVLTSPTQLAILLYDVLKQPVVDTKTPRGTGEDILLKMKLPLCKIILEQRGILKLLSTYIDKIPECVNKTDNRLHAHFNQLGADTGRFSSSNPNLQNIPSHEKSIRMMFKASDGYVMVGSDYSQQEPRLLSNYSQDENMINAYKEGKDLYATIASGIYNNDYWDNMEFRQNGTPNPEGKKRRSSCKSILLGLMYGRGVASIAEQVGCDVKEAQKIVDNFYTSFPKVKKWVQETETFAKKNGYVEDLWGRKRRLSDIQLPPYQVRFKDNKLNVDLNDNFNPLIGSEGIVKKEQPPLIKKYTDLVYKCKSKKEIEEVTKQALKDGVIIKNNNGFIAQAQRQSVNFRIQGGAATMSKKAMILIYNDEILNKLGFHLQLAVHDELIGECPQENSQEVAQRLTEVMKVAALPECTVPFKCDPTIEKCWYYTDYVDNLREEMNKLCKEYNYLEAMDKIALKYCEHTRKELEEMLKNS